MNNQKHMVAKVLDILAQLYPQAGTRLKFTTLFELLVAVILSAQSTDEQVNRVTAGLFEKYSRPEDFANLQPRELEELIKGCGLYRAKAGNIIKTAAILVETYQGQVPGAMDQLVKLPGVGRKTANVILSVGFGKPGLGVDTHVQRVAGRLGWHESRTAARTEKILKDMIPVARWSQAHHLLIAHGRAVCKARKPRCTECGVAKYCRCFREGFHREISGEE